MGLFDWITSMMGGGGEANKFKAILEWINQQGGVQTLLDKLHQGGLGDIVSSWLSNSMTNQALSGEQITSALGSSAVANLGAKLGIDTGAASSMLAEYLPKVIDALSPQGVVDPAASNDLMSAGLNLLKGKLFS